MDVMELHTPGKGIFILLSYQQCFEYKKHISVNVGAKKLLLLASKREVRRDENSPTNHARSPTKSKWVS